MNILAIAAFLLLAITNLPADAANYQVIYQRAVDAGDNLIYHAPPSPPNCKTNCRNALRRPRYVYTHAGLMKTVNYPRVVTDAGGGYVTMTCWYRENTPGVQRPDSDAFLGCSAIYQGVTYTSPTNSDTIATRIGTPNQDAPGCEGSQLLVNDDFVAKDSKGDTLRDINIVWSGGMIVGWMLQGFTLQADVPGGYQRYYMPNISSQPSINWNVGFKFLGAGDGPPSTGQGQVQKWSGSLPPGSQTKKCFSKGGALV